jgi:hypothetical protein
VLLVRSPTASHASTWRSATALRRRHGMVRQVLHKHATSLSGAGYANRSRRLIKCAKDSGHVL